MIIFFIYYNIYIYIIIYIYIYILIYTYSIYIYVGMGNVRYPQGLGQKPYFLHRKMETHTILQISLYSTYSNQSEWKIWTWCRVSRPWLRYPPKIKSCTVSQCHLSQVFGWTFDQMLGLFWRLLGSICSYFFLMTLAGVDLLEGHFNDVFSTSMRTQYTIGKRQAVRKRGRHLKNNQKNSKTCIIKRCSLNVGNAIRKGLGINKG